MMSYIPYRYYENTEIIKLYAHAWAITFLSKPTMAVIIREHLNGGGAIACGRGGLCVCT